MKPALETLSCKAHVSYSIVFIIITNATTTAVLNSSTTLFTCALLLLLRHDNSTVANTDNERYLDEFEGGFKSTGWVVRGLMSEENLVRRCQVWMAYSVSRGFVCYLTGP